MGDSYSRIMTGALFPFWERTIKRRPTTEILGWLRRSEWSSLEELRAQQLAELRKLLSHAYTHVPFYRERWQAIGMLPSDIRSLEQFRSVPILSRDDIRRCSAELKSTFPPLPTVHKQTSGTTGEPTLFAYDTGSEAWRQAVKLRAYGWAGYRVGSRVLYFWGASLLRQQPLLRSAKAELEHFLKREKYIYCASMSTRVLRRVCGWISRKRPDVVICYAQAGAELARYINRHKLRSWPDIPVICGAEGLLSHDRKALVEAFGPAIFDTFGCREVMLVGSECELHDGLHTSMENLIVEVLVTGSDGIERPAAPGEAGRVVITDLHNYGMPFIRYANGDMATMMAEGRCACGRSHLRIGAIEGRVSDTLTDGNGNRVSGISMSYIFATVGTKVGRFQMIQHKDRSITLNLVPNEELSRDTIESIRRDCAMRVPGVEVRTVIVPDLPRTRAGKHRLVVVERDEHDERPIPADVS